MELSGMDYFSTNKKNAVEEAIKKDNSFYKGNKWIYLCHGSNQKVIPVYGKGEKTNDYGLGFYTVGEKMVELAKEWSCSPFNLAGQGVVNFYRFDTEGLNILNLDKMDIIYWVAITVYYRKLNSNFDNLQELFDRYFINTEAFDCIYGWRCDDTFSRIITRFLDGDLSCKALYEATRLGYLQEQFVLKSKESFQRILLQKTENVQDFEKYRKRFMDRKKQADAGIYQCRNRNRDGKYIYDYFE